MNDSFMSSGVMNESFMTSRSGPAPRRQCRRGERAPTGGEQAVVPAAPQLEAARSGPGVELAVGAVVARLVGRFPQVVRPAGLFVLAGLLGPVAGPGEVAVEDPGRD